MNNNKEKGKKRTYNEMIVSGGGDAATAADTASIVNPLQTATSTTIPKDEYEPTTYSKKQEELFEFIHTNVRPEDHTRLNIIPLHETQLIGTKSIKQINKKEKRIKKKTISRKKYAELGLYTLGRNSMKYNDLLPLHELWKSYIIEHLSLPLGNRIPTTDTLIYDAYSKRLIKSDFHGAKIYVDRSKCPSLVGLNGIVAMDTKNTFKIVGEDNQLRTIPKPDSVFKIRIRKMEFTIFGKHLTIRPAERSVKKIKNFMELDL